MIKIWLLKKIWVQSTISGIPRDFPPPFGTFPPLFRYIWQQGGGKVPNWQNFVSFFLLKKMRPRSGKFWEFDFRCDQILKEMMFLMFIIPKIFRLRRAMMKNINYNVTICIRNPYVISRFHVWCPGSIPNGILIRTSVCSLLVFAGAASLDPEWDWREPNELSPF